MSTSSAIYRDMRDGHEINVFTLITRRTNRTTGQV
jgi:hypothetical protein